PNTDGVLATSDQLAAFDFPLEAIVTVSSVPSFGGVDTIFTLKKWGRFYQVDSLLNCTAAYAANTIVTINLPTSLPIASSVVAKYLRAQNVTTGAILDCRISLVDGSGSSVPDAITLQFLSAISVGQRVRIAGACFLF
ncbi:MAG: hypothetical protein ACRC62_38360, partial [Microcoleus sp.]